MFTQELEKIAVSLKFITKGIQGGTQSRTMKAVEKLHDATGSEAAAVGGAVAPSLASGGRAIVKSVKGLAKDFKKNPLKTSKDYVKDIPGSITQKKQWTRFSKRGKEGLKDYVKDLNKSTRHQKAL